MNLKEIILKKIKDHEIFCYAERNLKYENDAFYNDIIKFIKRTEELEFDLALKKKKNKRLKEIID